MEIDKPDRQFKPPFGWQLKKRRQVSTRTLDDSMSNKTLATRRANRDKENKTPYEAFSQSPSGYGWEEIVGRSLGLPG